MICALRRGDNPYIIGWLSQLAALRLSYVLIPVLIIIHFLDHDYTGIQYYPLNFPGSKYFYMAAAFMGDSERLLSSWRLSWCIGCYIVIIAIFNQQRHFFLCSACGIAANPPPLECHMQPMDVWHCIWKKAAKLLLEMPSYMAPGKAMSWSSNFPKFLTPKFAY